MAVNLAARAYVCQPAFDVLQAIRFIWDKRPLSQPELATPAFGDAIGRQFEHALNRVPLPARQKTSTQIIPYFIGMPNTVPADSTERQIFPTFWP